VTAIAVVAGPEDPRMTLDPIRQFNINSIFTIGRIGGHTIAFTNSTAYMFLTVAVICLLAVLGIKGRQLVPGRFQSAAELSYVFVATMIRSTAGEDGMKSSVWCTASSCSFRSRT
jgi:F-type H+-transporting ATPase subunit a